MKTVEHRDLLFDRRKSIHKNTKIKTKDYFHLGPLSETLSGFDFPGFYITLTVTPVSHQRKVNLFPDSSCNM